ncbi:MAG TPA: 16S rRNA (cytosine(967)-C(5))-methyltransferase RsmB [Solirubrobacteraceae bacterium]|jgi:16S rRNA (cytosine967-C5)-methyltransferase|nr:16S rRNA (cytosine(967)-C(5))-methyltransferase RsmB [Solirubrobacteraceae bacterium]
MPSSARVCAYAVLRRVFEQGAYADFALRAQARELDARDRALAMRLSYGAVQRRGTLDHLIERLAERPVQRLDAPVLAALRLGLYELLFLSGAPNHAVVADAVELAKVGRGHGLVNAVLRRATREGEGLLAALDDATPQGAAVKHSHPEWLARMWWEELGAEEARALLAYDNEPAELALRVNTLVAQPTEIAAQLSAGVPSAGAASADGASASDAAAGGAAPTGKPVGVHGDPAIPEALVLEGPWDVHGSPQWREGAVLAQSRAAMLPARALAPRSGERVLDLCAAPGGKTTHLAALMGGEGEVVAVEHNPRRAVELERTIARMRAGACTRLVVGDAARPLTDAAPYDRVLVDPPCSGLGTLQARADLRWRIGPEDPARLARIQAAILAAGAAAVRPGGVLVYSTCTISAIENQQQISAFLESHPEFALDDLGAELCDRAAVDRASVDCRLAADRVSVGCAGVDRMGGGRVEIGQGREGCVQTLPHRDRTAGFFIARLRRERASR